MNKYKAGLVVVFALLVNACTTLQSLDAQKVLESGASGLKQVSDNVFASAAK